MCCEGLRCGSCNHFISPFNAPDSYQNVSLWSWKPQQTVGESVEQVCCVYHLLGEPCAANISASVSSHIRGTEPFTVRVFMTYAFSCMTPYVVMTHSLGSFALESCD